jgi:hypothetical protein
MAILRRFPWLRPVAAVLGSVAFIGGVVALFALDNSAGSLFLMTLGVLILLVAILGGRIKLESFQILGAQIRVQEVVRSRLQLAQAPEAGHDGRDGVAREQAHTLQKLVGLYDLYEYIRKTHAASNRRTAALDEVARRMQAAGREAQFDAADVSAWFHQGDDPLRVVALNLMLAREECRDFLAVLKTITEPRSNFEQFYGMGLGHVMLPSLDELERRLLADAIGRAQRKRRLRRDKPLMRLSSAIVAELGEQRGTWS